MFSVGPSEPNPTLGAPLCRQLALLCSAVLGCPEGRNAHPWKSGSPAPQSKVKWSPWLWHPAGTLPLKPELAARGQAQSAPSFT